mmetsp:Transcript_18319/g.33065  ORF Transcript_18319/g.33065 Transcript_18319/m.33065 type:complete len:96 (-) Transcript_18319:10-297(-)
MNAFHYLFASLFLNKSTNQQSNDNDIALHLYKILAAEGINPYNLHCCSSTPSSPGGGHNPSNSPLCSISVLTALGPTLANTSRGSFLLSCQLSKQ